MGWCGLTAKLSNASRWRVRQSEFVGKNRSIQHVAKASENMNLLLEAVSAL